MRWQPPGRKFCTYSSTSITSEDNNKLTHKLVLEQPPKELSAIASLPVSPPNLRHASLVPTALVPTALAPTTIHSYLQAPAGPSEHQSPNPTCAGYAAHGQFAGHVAAAIDERAGFNPPNLPSLIPFVDSPLFGNLDLSTGNSTYPFSTEMLARAEADQLVDIYIGGISIQLSRYWIANNFPNIMHLHTPHLA
ncbi:hypothetical protein N7488_004741 [Penicillium malachiteum]|nr:hypothetical protein N7488_004741 [Penicillium malachiteum]